MPQMHFPLFPAEVTLINSQLGFQKKDERVYYFNGQMPLFVHDADDLRSFRMFTSQLVVNGNAKQAEIVRAFGVSRISVNRYVKKFRDEGIAGFYKDRASRQAHVFTPEVLKEAQALLDQSQSVAKISESLDLKSDTLRKAIADGRLHQPASRSVGTEVTTTKSQRSVEDSQAPLGRGCTRTEERTAASLGLISEAHVQFQASSDLSYAGVLLALPALLANGLLNQTKEHFELPKGFYSLTNIFLLLAFIALLRIKSLEGLRYQPPGELGKLLGLDRCPEVRTLRQKLDLLAEQGKAESWQMRLSKEWMQSHPEVAGLLYVDGHVRVYHGQQTKLPKRYVARQKLCLRGTTDYWLNDILGQPFFVVRAAVDPGLLSILRTEIVPRLFKDVPNQPTAEELEANRRLHRFGLVFDREGFSPNFFAEMRQQRIACFTYRKYQDDDWPQEEFTEQEIQLPSGETVTMKLAERGSLIGKTLWMREIRKLTRTGHQTAVISTDYLSEAAKIAVAMFSRWSQENFLKYMSEHFGLDKLIEYETEPIRETTKVVNPEYRTLDGQIRSGNGKLNRKKAEFGALVLAGAIESQKVEAFERDKARLQEEISYLQKEINDRKQKRKQVDKHITIAELPENEQFHKLAEEKKHIMDTIKMIAYRAETAMVNIIAPRMARSDEARSLLRQVYLNDADIRPNEQNQELEVQLHRLTNQGSDEIINHLCQELNDTETNFPGTKLRLVYKLVSD